MTIPVPTKVLVDEWARRMRDTMPLYQDLADISKGLHTQKHVMSECKYCGTHYEKFQSNCTNCGGTVVKLTSN